MRNFRSLQRCFQCDQVIKTEVIIVKTVIISTEIMGAVSVVTGMDGKSNHLCITPLTHLYKE